MVYSGAAQHSTHGLLKHEMPSLLIQDMKNKVRQGNSEAVSLPSKVWCYVECSMPVAGLGLCCRAAAYYRPPVNLVVVLTSEWRVLQFLFNVFH